MTPDPASPFSMAEVVMAILSGKGSEQVQHHQTVDIAKFSHAVFTFSAVLLGNLSLWGYCFCCDNLRPQFRKAGENPVLSCCTLLTATTKDG